MKKTIAEQIADLENTRAAKVAAMEEVGKKSMDAGRSMDEKEQEEFDTLEAEIGSVDADLKRFRSLERITAVKAKPVNDVPAADAAAASRGGATIVVRNAKLAPGVGFARLARIKAISRLDNERPLDVARKMYGEESDAFKLIQRATIGAGNTGGDSGDSPAGWAGALTGSETSVFADFVEYLRPMTILGKFGTNGIPSLRNVPFRTPLISQTSGGAGYWVGEGKAKPLTSFDFARTTLEPLKVANIAVVTEETLRSSSPSAETLIRDALAAALRERLDRDFIDVDNAGTAGIKPASITNGISPITSDGTDADAVRRDVRAIFAAFIAANNPPTSGVWIMPSTTALTLSLMVNALGQREFAGISMNGGTFEGLPVIASEFISTPSPGAIVTLVNASDIYEADEGGVNVDMSREASLEMRDDPVGDSVKAIGASSMVSMFQTNSVALRAERTISWKRRRTAGVQVLTDVDWAL